MKLNSNAKIYIPDGVESSAALSRTTHLAVSAHQDDIEFMAYSPISDCFGQKDKWFCAVVVTDGAGSPRNGIYASYTDEQMKQIRVVEQNKAACVGEYGAQILLGYPSSAVKDGQNDAPVKDLESIILATTPEYVYIHNLADKHETHVGTALKTIKALRSCGYRPKKVIGCEVWRDLDWVNDDEKIFLDTGKFPNVAKALSSVFDSQISGGKRYDLAIEGRRLSNATFMASHACDTYSSLNYGMDLTPLLDGSVDIADYVCSYIDRFRKSVTDTLSKLSK